MRRQIRRAERKGLGEGLARGLEHEQRLLHGMAARRFGHDAAERLALLLAGVGDPEGLDRVGAWLDDCADGEELIGRFGNGSDGEA